MAEAPSGSGEPSDRQPGGHPWIEHARGALVAAHILAVLALAIPSPGEFLARIERPSRERAALEAWSRGIGGEAGREEVQALIVRAARGIGRADRAVGSLLQPYVRWAGTGQGWQMFSTSPPTSFFLEFWLSDATGDAASDAPEGGEGAGWRRIYRSLDPGARWRAGRWEDGRVRGAINALSGPSRARDWRRLAEAAGALAARDFPAAARLRLQRVPTTARAPGEGRRDREAVGVEVVDLAALRGAR